jgi:hypothetical protein
MFFLFRSVLLRRFGPLGVALTAYDLWRRLPESRRRRLAAHGRRHGARAVRAAVAAPARIRERLT